MKLNIGSYSTINPTVLNKALIFAMKTSNLSSEEVDIILSDRQTVISYENKIWVKPNSYDLTGDSGEVSDIVEIYLFFQVKSEFPRILGALFRDYTFLQLKNSS